jgi:crossover junction endodeoxyribonuclease RusA
MTPIVITLPRPPSVNSMFANVQRKSSRGRYPTTAYRNWQNEAGWALKQQKPGKISGRYNVLFELGVPNKRRADLSNFWKGPSDLLVKMGVVEDDHLEQRVDMMWNQGVEGCRITLTPIT